MNATSTKRTTPKLRDAEVSVLIIGAGPSGATAALQLARLGIDCLVISRHTGTANTPRAHIFNQRAMEVLRDAGLEDKLRPVASAAHHMMHTSWLHSFNGVEYGRMYAWGNKPEMKGRYEAASPCAMSDLPQSILEPILIDEAEQAGAEVWFHVEFVSQQPILNTQHVETKVRDRRSGQIYTIRSRFLVGADGARSAVLDSLDIPVDGRQLNTAFNVHIKADLSRWLEVRPGSLNWILNPDAPMWSAVGNFRMVRPWNEFVVSMHPATKDGGGAVFEPSETDILQRLRQMIGDDNVAIEILSTFRWTINDQVARQWTKGNVICIGDAVHRHPPINGLGSNTCISDAMNISWKLAYVIKGIAHPRILDSITLERKPVGDGIVKRANEGMEDHRRLWDVIGLSAAEREQKTALLASPTPEGVALRKEFRAALEKTDDELNALGIQMNQIYLDSSLTVVEPNDHFAPDLRGVHLLKEVVVSTYPGHHLPHVWVAKDGQSHRVSTLDLCGKGAFTLITGIGGEKWRTWATSVEEARVGLTVNVVSIGWGQDYMDAYGDWEKVRGVYDDGAVLVRPDHFVTWRCLSLSDMRSPDRLAEVFASILPEPDR